MFKLLTYLAIGKNRITLWHHNKVRYWIKAVFNYQLRENQTLFYRIKTKIIRLEQLYTLRRNEDILSSKFMIFDNFLLF